MKKPSKNESEDKGRFQRLIGLGDLSSRKSYYPALQKTIENLKNEKEKFERIFSDALNGIFQSTIEGRTIIANPAMAEICGYDSPEDFIATVKDIGSQLFYQTTEYRRLIHRLRNDGFVVDYEAEFKRKDDILIIVSMNARLNETFRDGYIEFFVQDISDRKRHEKELGNHREHLEKLVNERTAELSEAKERAEAANRSKSEFLARMSHEIRTPLNAVTGLTNILLKSELTAEQRDYLNKVQIASNNLLEVINDILDFSKVEAGRLELAHEPFDLDQVMERLADLFSNRVGQKDLELIFTMAPDVPRQLIGDAGRLTQVLTNLVENAVKYTETGEIVVGVKTKGEGQEAVGNRQQLIFKVSDTGIGIDAGVLPTLFDPFTQVEGYLTRKHEGSGLGLAICQRLVELMGGRIWAESTAGQGSTFSFNVLFESQKEEKPRLSLPVGLHGIKTLVVDDSASSRQVLSDLLESFTFNVAAVDSGEKAIAALQREPYQLLLLDWKMPGMDGIETARRIREFEHHEPEARNQKPQTPIIILITACGQEIVQEHIETATVDTMLLKPVKASRLFNTIMELFGQKEAVVVSRTQEPTARPTLRLSGRSVLVVEDSELNRDVAVALLEEAGLVVETAENGRLAVDKVTGSPKGYYDAVLMDIQMPVMDGYEATRRIREWERQQTETRIPIIALTAHALKGEKEKCLAADMDDYLSKPLDEKDLRQMMLKWISPQQEKGFGLISKKQNGG